MLLTESICVLSHYPVLLSGGHFIVARKAQTSPENIRSDRSERISIDMTSAKNKRRKRSTTNINYIIIF